jgi:uncharacterized membrane protein YhaH (DUF805 family)
MRAPGRRGGMSKPVFEGLLTLEGRRNRRSFAWLMVFLVALQDAFFWAALKRQDDWSWELYVAVCAICQILLAIALAQRIRDIGRPGMLGLMGLVPGFGNVVALGAAFTPGQAGPNQYGPDPLRDALLGR